MGVSGVLISGRQHGNRVLLAKLEAVCLGSNEV